MAHFGRRLLEERLDDEEESISSIVEVSEVLIKNFSLISSSEVQEELMWCLLYWAKAAEWMNFWDLFSLLYAPRINYAMDRQ